MKGVSGALVTLGSVFSSFCFFTDGGAIFTLGCNLDLVVVYTKVIRC